MRVQNTRAPLVVQRKTGQRRIENGRPVEPQRGILGRSLAFVVIEMCFGSLQIPVGTSRLARRIGIGEERHLVLALEIDPFGVAVGFRLSRRRQLRR
ncbi:hypothetical protein SDC9_181421 [bioreactor metagenome]|uniref:Uncharacterized protein n=1 Tax=bioreactor metagenome TaxID=1076179 RepID=A0A645H767_9ZZZZ